MTNPENNNSENNTPDFAETSENLARVAGGAGFAFLGQMGALVEAVSVIAFTWFYGAATFGLFAVLWSYVKVSTAVSDAAMTTALQRFVPKTDEAGADMVTGYALKFSTILATLFAAVAWYYAPELAGFFNAAETDAGQLVTVIRIYVWVLPFWTIVEVATAAVRARRTFGPEIRVRIFYEQGLRLVAAVGFALAGFMTYGLFLSHLVSVILSAGLALRLVAKYYNFGAMMHAPLTGPMAREVFHYGWSLVPANLIKKLFSEFPVMFLNFMLPGAAGASAGGYYAVARKIASALQAVRTTFEYVIAPLASEKHGDGDHGALKDMYAYSTRLSITIALPFGAALILARHDILAVMKPEFQAAAIAIAVLCAGRIIEAATGPSSALIEMLGHRLLPAINGIAGLATLLILGNMLIPEYGVTGAAFAAAAGINATAILAFIQTLVIYGLWPYDRFAFKPVCVSLLTSAIMFALIPYSKDWAAPIGIIASVGGLLLAMAMLIRYGLSHSDAVALGRFGKLKKIKKLAED